MFSLDYSEPVELATSDSVIRKLDAGFRETGLAYKLVDYGPLSLQSAKKESACSAKISRWARFWAWVARP
jgi:hypothetical protein